MANPAAASSSPSPATVSSFTTPSAPFRSASNAEGAVVRVARNVLTQQQAEAAQMERDSRTGLCPESAGPAMTLLTIWKSLLTTWKNIGSGSALASYTRIRSCLLALGELENPILQR